MKCLNSITPHQIDPFVIEKSAMTNGKAGVIHPGAIGSPKIIGLEVIKYTSYKSRLQLLHLMTILKLIPTGAAASAVAPDITKP